MSPAVILVLLMPVLTALGVIFALNVRRGYKTGVIWSSNIRVYRATQPINFHITVVAYVIATLACMGGIGVIVFVLVTSS